MDGREAFPFFSGKVRVIRVIRVQREDFVKRLEKTIYVAERDGIPPYSNVRILKCYYPLGSCKTLHSKL